VGAKSENEFSRQVWLCAPSLSPWHRPHDQGYQFPVTTQHPIPFQDAPERKTHPSSVQAAVSRLFSQVLFFQLGFPASFQCLAWHEQTCGVKATASVEGPSWSRLTGMREQRAVKSEGESLNTGVSVLVSHGAWSQTSLRHQPTRALTQEVSISQGDHRKIQLRSNWAWGLEGERTPWVQE
jgi:hypothetical protein